MGTIGFTNKPDPSKLVKKEVKKKEEPVKIIPADKSWCRRYCVQCPYFVNDESAEMIHCVRPAGENCLADNVLVAGAIMNKEQSDRLRKVAAAEATRMEQRKLIKHKKINRRR